jgi:hypothetical protein
MRSLVYYMTSNFVTHTGHPVLSWQWNLGGFGYTARMVMQRMNTEFWGTLLENGHLEDQEKIER